MKDPADNKTIDGFEDPKTAKKKRPGRKPRGEQALSAAEKQKAYRDRQRERKKALANGDPVESKIIDLNTRLSDVLK